MGHNAFAHSRRRFLASLGLAAGAVVASRFFDPGVFAEELAARVRTPQQTEGPFFPDKLPLDTDNDLLVINDAITPAVGTITHLGGRILDRRGEPVKNAVVEIWQVDGHGNYLHSEGANPRAKQRDRNFQGYGRFLTAASGEYYFRTIRPVSYPGRTPHIHVRVTVKNRVALTTQFYVKGEKQNDRDGILQGVRDAAARETVIADYTPVKDSKIGELAARYEVVLGLTPEA
jgi:protocatechuate 3,4-dioxygenase beta subunit